MALPRARSRRLAEFPPTRTWASLLLGTWHCAPTARAKPYHLLQTASTKLERSNPTTTRQVMVRHADPNISGSQRRQVALVVPFSFSFCRALRSAVIYISDARYASKRLVLRQLFRFFFSRIAGCKKFDGAGIAAYERRMTDRKSVV